MACAGPMTLHFLPANLDALQYGVADSSSFAGRPGELSHQSSKQHPAAPAASASFNKGAAGGGGVDVKQQLQPCLSGRQRQGGGNQLFLKHYSLDRKGLFAP
jgi:hypothetical protein